MSRCLSRGLIVRLPTRATVLGLLLAVVACGGSDSNPAGALDPLKNPEAPPQPRLSFAYYQRCIHPLFLAALPAIVNGASATSSCAASGCHGGSTAAGERLRVDADAVFFDLTNASVTTQAVKASAMYRSFLSAQGMVTARQPLLSPLLTKPLEIGGTHLGGRNFANLTDANARLIQYWINNPAADGQDEFNASTYALFTPSNPTVGTCNTQ